MLTSDLALREDPIYANISLAYKNNFTALTNDFAHAWYVASLILALRFRPTREPYFNMIPRPCATQHRVTKPDMTCPLASF